uniref:Uncharacterized protein n=1 Tax=Trichogramma kaykai TaxID=54128 RepID=A0ABD2W995_9HYME
MPRSPPRSEHPSPRAWVRSPPDEFSRFVFSPGVVEPVPEVERVPLKKKTLAMSSASEAVKKTPITVRAGSDRITTISNLFNWFLNIKELPRHSKNSIFLASTNIKLIL